MIKKILTKSTFALGIGGLLLVPALAFPVSSVGAQPDPDDPDARPSGIQQNLDFGARQTDPSLDEDDDAEDTVFGIIATVINIFSLVVGVISVIMIIIGGLKYITSGGDSGNVTGAKNTILYAVIGLVIVALAQIIVRFVLTQVVDSGSDPDF